MIIIRTATNKAIEKIRMKLETLSTGKQLSHPEVILLSNKLDEEIIKFMKQQKNN